MNVNSFSHRGFTVEVETDDDPEHPRRDYDNFGTMVCWHRRYNLGDKQPREDAGDFLLQLARDADKRFDALCDRWDSTGDPAIGNKVREQREKVLERHYIMLPLYLYDHSGITMSTGPFSCPWDSGQVGFIYATKQAALENWSKRRLSDKVVWTTDKGKERITVHEAARRLLEGEVETYDQFLTGDVYRVTVKDAAGDEVVDLDLCGGWFGYDNTKEDGEMVREAKSKIDCFIARRLASPEARCAGDPVAT